MCGNVKLVNGQFHATEHAVVVAALESVNVTWLFYQLTALNLNQYATGSAQPGLSVRNIVNINVPVPPLAIQTQLVAEIEVLEQQIAQHQATINQAASLKQVVMQKYL